MSRTLEKILAEALQANAELGGKTVDLLVAIAEARAKIPPDQLITRLGMNALAITNQATRADTLHLVDAIVAIRDILTKTDEGEPSTPTRPTVVCLCGSTRFHAQFQEANYRETMAGRVVLSVGFYPHSSEVAHGETLGCTDEQKARLDELHLRKIDMADEVLILNVGGYIGESTGRELSHAIAAGKNVRFLEPESFRIP